MIENVKLHVRVVADTLNFSRAEEELHVSQPAVTSQVRSLEAFRQRCECWPQRGTLSHQWRSLHHGLDRSYGQSGNRRRITNHVLIYCL